MRAYLNADVKIVLTDADLEQIKTANFRANINGIKIILQKEGIGKQDIEIKNEK